MTRWRGSFVSSPQRGATKGVMHRPLYGILPPPPSSVKEGQDGPVFLTRRWLRGSLARFHTLILPSRFMAFIAFTPLQGASPMREERASRTTHATTLRVSPRGLAPRPVVDRGCRRALEHGRDHHSGPLRTGPDECAIVGVFRFAFAAPLLALTCRSGDSGKGHTSRSRSFVMYGTHFENWAGNGSPEEPHAGRCPKAARPRARHVCLRQGL